MRIVRSLAPDETQAYNPGMVRAVKWAFVIGLSLFPCAAGADPLQTDACAKCRDGSSADEDRAFEADMERYARLAAFTRKLGERAFEEAAERFARYSEITRRLAEEARVREEEHFEADVDLYLKKRELTRTLAARAASEPKPSLSAPDW